MTPPREATVAVTSQCNSRCVMCNIWRETDRTELAQDRYLVLPSSLRTINVTGGEPFMRGDIVEVVRRIHEAAPRSRIVISTNGYLTERIVGAVKEIKEFHPRLGVGVSIDGIGEAHDKIRGLKGSYERAVETLGQLKALKVDDLRIGMTILPENQNELTRVFELAEALGVEFTTTIAHNSGIYFKKTDNAPAEVTDQLRKGIQDIMRGYLRSFDVKRWFKAYHLAGLIDPGMRMRAAKDCEAGRRFFFLDSKGRAYPCIVLDSEMGDIEQSDDFQSLFTSGKADEARRVVRSCRQDCWMVCNIRSYLIRHPWAPAYWIAKNKLRAHLLSRAGS